MTRALFLAATLFQGGILRWYPTAAETNVYIDADKDPKVSKLAIDKSAELCSGGFQGGVELEKNRGQRTKDLENAVGDNIMMKILSKSKSQSELADNAKTELKPGWLIQKAGAIVVAIICFISWWICCWSCCPCCQCCRCCKKERSTRKCLKYIGLVLSLGIVVGMIVCGSVAIAGYGRMKEGFLNMQCTASKLLNMTLNGYDNPRFIGMLPLLNEFYGLDQMLEPTSQFMVDLNNMLDNTAIIDSSVNLAGGTLGLLTTVLGDPSVRDIGSKIGKQLYHECKLCGEISSSLQPIVSELQNGVGEALAKARSEVRSQLSGSAREQLQSVTRNAAKPLMSVKDLIRNAFEGFVDSGGSLAQAKAQIASPGATFACVVLLVWGLIISVYAGLTFMCCICREKKKDEGRYNPAIHRCAATTWCCGCYLSWIAFLIGGLLVILSVPLSGICLIMDQLSSATLKQILPAFGAGNAIDNDLIYDVIDQCFAVRTGNANLLDIVKTQNSSGDMESLRTSIVDKVKSQILSKFEDVSSKMSSGNGSLAMQPGIIDLRKVLRDNRLEILIMPKQDIASQFPLLMNGGGTFPKFPVTSMACLDLAPDGLGDGVLVPGISQFDTAMSAKGARLPASRNPFGCNFQVVCSNPQDKVCSQGNAYLDLKVEVTKSVNKMYRCDVFAAPGIGGAGADCDILSMTENIDGTYTNDCVGFDGKIITKERLCNFDEFRTYLRDFDQRIDLALKRLDKAVTTTQSKITTTLKGLVQVDVIDVITRIADGAGCGFLTITYREMVDGLCFQGVWGLSKIGSAYAAGGAVTLLLVIFMYFVWRRSIDNYNSVAKTEVVMIQ